jgi:hypothetical protein
MPRDWCSPGTGYNTRFRIAVRRVHPILQTSIRPREVVMPVWAWILIIVLLVLLLTGGVYVRR